MTKLIIAALSVLTLTSCEHAPYIMEGIAQGLAETSYQLELEQRRQYYYYAEQNRINYEFREGMHRRQHHDLYHHSDTNDRNSADRYNGSGRQRNHQQRY